MVYVFVFFFVVFFFSKDQLYLAIFLYENRV